MRNNILAVLGLLLCVTAAPAQVTKAAATGPGMYTTVGIAGSLYRSDYGKSNLYGPTLYVDANFHRYVGLEGEARFLRWGGKQGIQQNTYLIGPRVSFKPVGWVPYVKMPVGLGTMRFPYGYANGQYFVMAPGGGLEKWISNDNIHIRVVDVEYQVWPQFTFGTLKPYGISTGISFRVW